MAKLRATVAVSGLGRRRFNRFHDRYTAQRALGEQVVYLRAWSTVQLNSRLSAAYQLARLKGLH